MSQGGDGVSHLKSLNFSLPLTICGKSDFKFFNCPQHLTKQIHSEYHLYRYILLSPSVQVCLGDKKSIIE